MLKTSKFNLDDPYPSVCRLPIFRVQHQSIYITYYFSNFIYTLLLPLSYVKVNIHILLRQVLRHAIRSLLDG